MLNTADPHIKEGFNGAIKQSQISSKEGKVKIEVTQLTVDSIIRDKLFTLPKAVIRSGYEFICANGNHWIQDFNFVERDIYK